ncbi:MAG TPA: hypothetical protein VM100_14395 [Longimicrobiales bacterium]|nr:hypothetical protein [Longimicrobiales bacterium]
MPATFAAIAAQANVRVVAQSVALPNLALIDHVKGESNALAVLRAGKWDYVVLQQGPTSEGPSPGRDTLILATQMLDTEIRKNGARTALYMVWPTRERLAYFDNVRDAYKAAADTVHGLLIPVGEAWRIAWKADSTLALYSADDFHPSPSGTRLAALVMAEQMACIDVRTLPLPKTDAAMERVLRNSAHTAAKRYR